MISEPAKSLTDLAVRIATNIMPALSTSYGQADAGMLTALLLTMAQDYERAVFNRMADINEFQKICRECADRDVTPVNLDDLTTFADKAPTTLLLKDVNALHAESFNLLSDLHAWAEDHDEALNLELWRLLRRHSERNKFDIPFP